MFNHRSVTDTLLQFVTFHVGGEEYAVDILSVQEIINMPVIMAMPNAPDFVEGVVNLRGRVIPVVDLRKRFGFTQKTGDAMSRIIVVDIGTTIGMVVDSVSEVLRLSTETIEPPPPMATAAGNDYIIGVCKLENRLVIYIDVKKLFSGYDAQISQKIGHEDALSITDEGRGN